MSMQGIAARRVRRAQAGVGSATICLATSFGLQAQAADADANASKTVEDLIVTASPSISAFSGTLQNTAQNVNVIPAQVLTDQAVSSVQEALKNVPGITLNAGEGGTHGDNINLRGFAASDDFFLDGLRDTGFYTRDSFNLEALEVYKGPASAQFGRGSTGGVVNQVSKTPQLSDFYNGTLVGSANSEGRATADLNYAINDDTAVRLNAMGEDAGVAGRDYVENRRWGVAPSVSFGIGKPVSLTLNYLHQEQNDTPDYGIPFAFGAPVPVPRKTYYGLPSDDRTITRDDIGTALFRAEISDKVWFTDTARAGNYYFDSRMTAAHYGATPPAPGTPLADVLTFRDRPSVAGTVSTLMNDADLHWKFDLGPVSNHAIFGIELDREESDLERFANQLNQIPGTPILDPDPNEPFPGRQTQVTSRPDTVTKTVSGLIEDTLDFGEHFEATTAVRLDRFNATYNEPITAQHFEHTDTIASPRVALVYKPTSKISVYAAYGTSYDPSAENLSLSAKTASLAPERDHTYEVGVKGQALDGKLALQAAIFQTNMENARVGDPTNPANPQILAGEERVRGFEADAIGHLTEHLEIIAGYTYLDSVTLKSTDPLSVGAPLLNTAPNQANLWLEYEFTGPWEIGAGLNYLDRRAADVDNTAHVPSYVTLDAMVKYRVNSHLTLQLNGTNLTDKYYFANSYFSSPEENHVLPGPGRTVLLTASISY
ncbi:TonB-dependent siderophore receptor [Phenylobacterium sp.]|uniref:TonB-dependent receptor n=1 Tax=Phenylobacterium sp. TaxID=1871053 RepID=UPI0025CF436E|nr:TonB-dependent siderophore receptor [Phenylobacterium sp.]